MHFPTDRTAHTTIFDGPVVGGGPLAGTENSQTANASICYAESIRPVGGSKPLQLSALLPEICPAPRGISQSPLWLLRI